MANEITPPGMARPLRTPPAKSVTDKQKAVPIPKKKPRDDKKKPSDNDGQIHIDEYI